MEPSSTAVCVAEGLSAQSAAESSPPARKLPTAVQSESTATCRALDNKMSIDNKSSNSNGDSKLTPPAIGESAWPNKNKIRRSRIPQAAVTPVRATAASRTAAAVVERKTPVRAASTSRVPWTTVTGVNVTKSAPNVGRSSSSVAVNKIGTCPPTRTVNGTRTTSAAAASRSAYCDDNKVKEKEKPKRNVKSGLTTPVTPSAPVQCVASKIPRPCPPKKASSPSVDKIHWPAATNGKATLVKTVKKKPIGSSHLSQQASHRQGESPMLIGPVSANCDQAQRTKDSTTLCSCADADAVATAAAALTCIARQTIVCSLKSH